MLPVPRITGGGDRLRPQINNNDSITMMNYLFLKHAHAGFAYLTVTLLVLRGLMMLYKPAWLGNKVIRILPHVIDTLLLACAIAMLVMADLNPFIVPWLLAKIIALLLYIVLGSIALKRGKTRQGRIVALVLALLTVIYIIAVAKTKLVWPF